MLRQAKTWIVVVLRFIDMVSCMNQNIEVELEISRFEFQSYSDLHAHFDALMDIFRLWPKIESCFYMSLLCTY